MQQLFYIGISAVGGFFVIAIPWSGVLLILAKRTPEASNSQIVSAPAKNRIASR